MLPNKGIWNSKEGWVGYVLVLSLFMEIPKGLMIFYRGILGSMGGVAVRLLTSHKYNPGLIPSRLSAVCE